MNNGKLWMGAALLAAACFGLGHWTASGRPVRAASEDVQFQLQGVRQDSSLLVYYAGERTVYLYQGVMVGNAALQCN